jgi:hypothetical protein
VAACQYVATAWALVAHIGGWGVRHTPASKELSVRAKILEDGGPKLWSAFMEELRHLHLEAPAPRGSVFSRLHRPTKPPLPSRWSERNDRHSWPRGTTRPHVAVGVSGGRGVPR